MTKNNIKLLIAGGCSFTKTPWPRHLQRSLYPDAQVLNVGTISSGNDYILRAIIHSVHKSLNEGYKPEEILVVAMWSGIDRRGYFVSESETANYDLLVNKTGITNPVNFWEGLNRYDNVAKSGWLLGSLHCGFTNERINTWNRKVNKMVHTYEGSAHNSFMHFLSLQTLCESLNIQYLNTTYAGIMHYPTNEYSFEETPKGYAAKTLVWDSYPSINMYKELLNFDNWVFWKDYYGLYEYMVDNDCPSEDDGFHPARGACISFVEDVLVPYLKAQG